MGADTILVVTTWLSLRWQTSVQKAFGKRGLADVLLYDGESHRFTYPTRANSIMTLTGMIYFA